MLINFVLEIFIYGNDKKLLKRKVIKEQR